MQFILFLLIGLLCFGSYADQLEVRHKAIKTLENVVVYPQRSAPAEVLSLNDTVVSSQLLTVVDQVYARVSAQVKKGDLLAKLDCTDYRLNKAMAQAQLEQAEAAHSLATNELSRARNLFNKKLSSEQQVDLAVAEEKSKRAMVKQQQVSLERSGVDIGRCKVRAPVNGIITKRSLAVGQLATVGMALFSIVDEVELELSANISTNDIASFSDRSRFNFDNGKLYPASLFNSGGVVNTRSRNIEMRFSFDKNKPLPGSAGRLVWFDSRPDIPAAYIVERNGKGGVFILNPETRRLRFHSLPAWIPGRPSYTELPLNVMILTEQLGLVNDGDVLELITE